MTPDEIRQKFRKFLEDCNVPSGQVIAETLNVLAPVVVPAVVTALSRIEPGRKTSAAKGEITKRPKKRRGPRFTLPALPDGMSWPEEQYENSDESRLALSRRGALNAGIVPYIERVWVPLQKAGVKITLPMIRHFDASAGRAIDRHTLTDPKTHTRRPIPFGIPREREANDEFVRQHGSIEEAVAARPELYETLRSRKRRGNVIPVLPAGV